jgi:hypothetical protein
MTIMTCDAANDVRRRRWGAVEKDINAPGTFSNDAGAVEDPGEVDGRASSLWASSSWFASSASAGAASSSAFSAVTANAESVGYGDKDGGATVRAPGGATCQNRFIVGRGARDPFAPASEDASASGKALDCKLRGKENDNDAWVITRWDTTLVPGGVDDTREDARAASGRRSSFRAFEGCAPRRIVGADAADGATFEFDAATKEWVVVREGGRVRETVVAGEAAEPCDGHADLASAQTAAEDVDAMDADAPEPAPVDHEMLETVRQERLRRYQTSHEESSARFALEERARRRRSRSEIVRDAPIRPPLSVSQMPNAKEPRVIEECERESAPTTRWVPLSCENGCKVWIETAVNVDIDEQLASWVSGESPWPRVVDSLDLGRDRAARGIPRDAPGPVTARDDILSVVRAELSRVHAERTAVASPSTSAKAADAPRARAADPTDRAAVDAANVVDAVVRAATATNASSSPNAQSTGATDERPPLTPKERVALEDALRRAIRDKHAALESLDRARARLLAAGLPIDDA